MSHQWSITQGFLSWHKGNLEKWRDWSYWARFFFQPKFIQQIFNAMRCCSTFFWKDFPKGSEYIVWNVPTSWEGARDQSGALLDFFEEFEVKCKGGGGFRKIWNVSLLRFPGFSGIRCHTLRAKNDKICVVSAVGFVSKKKILTSLLQKKTN